METKSNSFKKLLKLLDLEGDPQIVQIQLEEYSVALNCFFNVQKKQKIDGGKIRYGWKIHENIFFWEAERHAIWESESGKLLDITPDNLEAKKSETLFLLDDSFVYNGNFTPNVRVSYNENIVVDDYIFILNKIDELYGFSERVDEDRIEIEEPILNLIRDLKRGADFYYTILTDNFNKRSICYCDSQKRYKNCHGLKIRKDLQRKVEWITKNHHK